MQTINFELDGKKYCCKKLNAKVQLKLAARLGRGDGSLLGLSDDDLDYAMGKLLGTLQVQESDSKMWVNVVTNDTPEYEFMDEGIKLKTVNELSKKVTDIHFGDFSEGAPSDSK